MTIEISLTPEASNTQYAPLALLLAHYTREKRLEPLKQAAIPIKTVHFTPASKLQQVLVSVLAGCETLSEVNSKLKPEPYLAQTAQWSRFADQSTLSATLDGLTQMNLRQLAETVHEISWANSALRDHDWRGFLWLDFDLSGLACSTQAEQSTKGYFSGKKTLRVAS